MQSKKSTGKGKIYCLISAILIIGCYAAEKLIVLTVEPNRTLLLCEAMVFSLAVAAVYFLVSKSNEAYYGILTAIFGFRMLPPELNDLEAFSPGGYIVYYIVQMASLAIFAYAIVKLYKQQIDDKNKVKIMPIIFLLVCVPFANEIGNTIANFVNGYANGNKIWMYLIQFAFYALAMLITFWYASKSNYTNSRLMCDYSIVALAINFARRFCIVAVYLANGWHISRSYYCWMAIYVFFAVVFLVLKQRKSKSLNTAG